MPELDYEHELLKAKVAREQATATLIQMLTRLVQEAIEKLKNSK